MKTNITISSGNIDFLKAVYTALENKGYCPLYTESPVMVPGRQYNIYIDENGYYAVYRV